MIKFEHTEVMNWDGAIRGMRNPMYSWEKSDSGTCGTECTGCKLRDNKDVCDSIAAGEFYIGPNDLALMKKLINAGTDHRKFMRQIMVSVDITAPLYWWKEFDTYKVGTVANSCSTMHKIHEKPFVYDDFSHEHLDECDSPLYRNVMGSILEGLNVARDRYLDSKEKIYWWQMIQLLPTSYNQRRTVTLNYEVLANIYKSRKAHKLDEWRVGFMEWIESLPYSELITQEWEEES